MSKSSVVIILLLVFGFAIDIEAQAQRSRSGPRAVQPARRAQSPAVSLNQVQTLISQNRFGEASIQLYRLTGNRSLDRLQVKYLFGLTLLEQGYYQLAAIQFVDVIRQGGNSRYLRQSIDKLSIAADELGDETLLNYALRRVDTNSFPRSRRDTLFYRLGENAYLSGRRSAAALQYAKVPSNSRYYFSAQYQLMTIHLENNRPNDAIQVARRLQSIARNPNDLQIANLGLARSYYQKQDWDNAIKHYRQIPRDSRYWGDSLFETSWAQLRSARFRSVLGTLQTLHSPFYEEEYMPESLLVRGIVYLYICKFDELEKTMNLFEGLYGQYANRMSRFYSANARRSRSYLAELVKADEVRRGLRSSGDTELPYPVIRSILQEGDVQRTLKYQQKVSDEMRKIEGDLSLSYQSFQNYARRVLSRRMQNSQNTLSDLVRSHLNARMREWRDLEEQAGFLRYEMINGQKEMLRQRIAGKDLPAEDIDSNRSRDFYVESGYEYWPVDSEVWLDELGNFHYIGQQSCR